MSKLLINLPKELLEEFILPKIKIKDLINFNNTCKQYSYLSKSDIILSKVIYNEDINIYIKSGNIFAIKYIINNDVNKLLERYPYGMKFKNNVMDNYLIQLLEDVCLNTKTVNIVKIIDYIITLIDDKHDIFNDIVCNIIYNEYQINRPEIITIIDKYIDLNNDIIYEYIDINALNYIIKCNNFELAEYLIKKLNISYIESNKFNTTNVYEAIFGNSRSIEDKKKFIEFLDKNGVLKVNHGYRNFECSLYLCNDIELIKYYSDLYGIKPIKKD